MNPAEAVEGYIFSGAETPISTRTWARTIWQALTDLSQALLRGMFLG